MSDLNQIWWVLFFPVAGFLFQSLAGKSLVDGLAEKFGIKTARMVAGAFAVLPIAMAFLFGLSTLLSYVQRPADARLPYVTQLFDWIHLQSIQVPFEFRVDSLSLTMVMIITGIGALIHLYAVGYMAEERDFTRFFTYLNLFIAAMLILVLGNNLVLTFMGWEGVGLCSYLLIGFWFKDLYNAKAANKAFIVNRVGDWGFTLGMFGILVVIASSKAGLGINDGRWLSYDVILPRAAELLAAYPGWSAFIAVMLFIGAAGKSAQFPLYVWLPDAMAGPTPVSALIHAATMVTSGIYLLNRMSEWFLASPFAMGVVALIGALTALLGALIAFGQTDTKKVLAYSTVSQLGYMFIGCGVGAFSAGMFHVVTHAFFKALLFLGSGAVIHAMAHNQDMRNYGNLRKYLPVTFWTMAIGWAAIAGVPFLFSGFWSKEAILGPAVNSSLMLGTVSAGQIAGWTGFLVAALTACYMTRMMLLTFFSGEGRWKLLPAAEHSQHGHADHHAHHAAHHGDDPHGFYMTEHADEEEEHHHELDGTHEPHEVSPLMWVPLVVLAVCSFGWLGWMLSDEASLSLNRWLYPAHHGGEHAGPVGHTALILISVTTATLGILAGIALYGKKLPEREGFDLAKWNPAQRWAGKQFGIDAFLSDGSVKAGGVFGAAFAAFDKWVVDGVVNLVGMTARVLGGGLRQMQTGNVRNYALWMQLGAAGFIGYIMYVLANGGPK